MLINRLHHPLLHNASRVWPMDVNIRSRLFILEPDTRPRRTSLRMLRIAEVRQKTQRFFIRKVLWSLFETLN